MPVFDFSCAVSCSCDCLGMLVQECNKLGLLSELNTACLTAKRYSFLFVFSLLVFICNCFNKLVVIFCCQAIRPLHSFTPFLSYLCPCDHSLLQISFRTEDREFAPRLKTAENANIQPNPGLILRAEPTVTNILKVEWHKIPNV